MRKCVNFFVPGNRFIRIDTKALIFVNQSNGCRVNNSNLSEVSGDARDLVLRDRSRDKETEVGRVREVNQ